MAFQKGSDIVFYDFNELKDLYSNKVIDDHSVIFDPLVQNKGDFQKRFKIPFSESPYFRTISWFQIPDFLNNIGMEL